MVTPPTKLPTHDPTPLEPRHKWGEATYAGERAERTERLCALCGLVKDHRAPATGLPVPGMAHARRQTLAGRQHAAVPA